MERIKTDTTPVQNVTIVQKEKKEHNAGAFVDGILTALVIIIVFALTASYFIVFDGTVGLNITQLTFNTIWFAIGTISVGLLVKKIAKNKGRETKEYQEAEKKANEAIKGINERLGADRAAEYCEACTAAFIERKQKYYLSNVGLTVTEYKTKYFGAGKKALKTTYRSGELTKEQYNAVRKCDKIKIKEYDTKFILSYESEIDSDKLPSAMYNTERNDTMNTVKSVISTLFSSAFVCTLTANIIYDFSRAAVIGAITKIVMILVNVAFKSSFGWNIAQKELKRNLLRASEAEACEKWCRENPVTVKTATVNATTN